jgi:hypothetical protein
MLTGLSVTMWIFIWAVKRGQFDDQDRARYIPLVSEPLPPAPAVRHSRSMEFIFLIIVFILAFSSIVRMLYLVITN